MLFADPVEVHRAPLTEGTYTRQRDWGHAVLVWSGLGSVQPDRGFEARSPERETAQERLLVYLPWGVPVDSADRIRHDGIWYEVDGEPKRWGQGNLRHVTVRVWRVQH